MRVLNHLAWLLENLVRWMKLAFAWQVGHIKFQIKSRSRARHSPSIERAFLNDEIDKINTQIWDTKRAYKRKWAKIRNFLSFYDLFQFCRYLSEIDQRTENVTNKKKKNTTGTFNFYVRDVLVAC